MDASSQRDVLVLVDSIERKISSLTAEFEALKNMLGAGGSSMDDMARTAVVKSMEAGENKFSAMREFRDQSGCGLLEAKHYIEKYWV